MKHDSFKTYLHWGLTAFGVVALSILFFFSLFKVGALVHFFQTLTGILMPFVYGLAMAYLLTPGVQLAARALCSPRCKNT